MLKDLRTIIYLDDILIMHQSKESLLQEVKKTSNFLETLGFTINHPKSQMTPIQQIQFLGFLVDSKVMKLFLPEGKMQEIAQLCQEVTRRQTVSICHISQLLGKMVAASPAVLSAPLRYRHLQLVKIRSLGRYKSFNKLVTLDQKAIEELRWWQEQLACWNGKDIIPPPIDLVIETDASVVGWGAVCSGTRTGGLWSQQERHQHINVLELTAGMFAVQSFVKERQDLHVHLRMDNTSALSYVNKMGGYLVPQTDRGDRSPVKLVPSTKDNTVSLTPPRTEQPSSRPGVQTGSNLS